MGIAAARADGRPGLAQGLASRDTVDDAAIELERALARASIVDRPERPDEAARPGAGEHAGDLGRLSTQIGWLVVRLDGGVEEHERLPRQGGLHIADGEQLAVAQHKPAAAR